MKKFLLGMTCLLLHAASMAQIVLPHAPAPLRAVVNPDMLIQFNGQRIEILSTQRAIRNSAGIYGILGADALEVITRDKLGVAYSYALRGPVFLTGEVSVKLRPGFQANSLNEVGISARLLVPPDVYLLKVNTPNALVSLVKQLQLIPAVEWVEPYTIQGNMN
jgi:hypothetical protein